MKTIVCGIYKITSPTNKIYIGQSIDIEFRWEGYKKTSCENQSKLYYSLKKHGVENHTFEIIEECSQELLNEREIYWIKHFDTFDTPHGMNLRSGGSQGLLSEETRKKISEKLKGNTNSLGYKFTEEKSKERGEIHKGNKYLLGYKFTEEQLVTHSKAQIGNKNGSGRKGKKYPKNQKKDQNEKITG